MKLLIVEDHPSLRDLLARHLRRSGFVVDAAEDGKAALAMLELSQYDAMLLDLGLPDMDGLQLLNQRSSSRNPHLPRGMVQGALLVGFVAVIVAGIVTAATGEREFHQKGSDTHATDTQSGDGH